MTNSASTIRLFGSVADSIVDGPGLRYAVFVQGCVHHCAGCHNQESWAFDAGEVVAIDDVFARIAENKLAGGVTLSGGDPFCQPEACARLAAMVKQTGRNVWTYTGYVYEDLLRLIKSLETTSESDGRSAASMQDEGGEQKRERSKSECGNNKSRARAMRELLDNTDVLVDGPFMQEKRSLGLKYCGSSNQRLIDMNKTREAGTVVLWESHDVFPTKPASW